VVCLQVKLCDQHLSALEVRFSRRGAILIHVYLYLEVSYGDHDPKLHDFDPKGKGSPTSVGTVDDTRQSARR